ncbi:helix-turn-helix domain-containing protein [Chitinophaga filiformis]|uniref:AraC family transcriptional regulator n=1 Tax=Chitinophaga filiformis TaxID=104663 RepID=UPI001F321E62|nr:helix-turn-helix domain-containing protein [Chitinophaga filiformis]MCF6402505.1 helix-turn-helix domain-containing protein [Chitinophaga filiformis]
MQLEFTDKSTLGRFVMRVNDQSFRGEGVMNGQKSTINTFVINKGEEQQVTIDEIVYTMPPHSVLPLVANQHFLFEKPELLLAWQFNREFYCIMDHDAEVSCVGFIFYGIKHPMFIPLSAEEMQSLATIEQLFLEDMQLRDSMQGEMLRTLLKRVIINVTRIARKQTACYQRVTEDKMDIIRQFNLLLEINFRKEHEVMFYAEAMNKSPKTLTNVFRICNCPSPSALIHNRIILEAKRYLYYTDKSAKEIGYSLGFESPAHFSRFFKLKTGCNVSRFRTRDCEDRSRIA